MSPSARKPAELHIMKLTAKQLSNYIRSGKVRICVIGLGRVGLPIAVSFASKRIKCTGVDVDPSLVESLNNGKTKFDDEPELAHLLKRVVKKGLFKATVDIRNAVSTSHVIVICLPSPFNYIAFKEDYSAITNACIEIGPSLRKHSLIIIESTVSPGIVEDLVIPTLEKNSNLNAGIDFGIASCPERVNPTEIMKNLKEVPRVIGGFNEKSGVLAQAIYEHVYGVQIVKVRDCKTANAVKLTENVFRYVNIAYVNELAFLYEKMGIDINEVINACKTKYNFIAHYPSGGVGGPCLPANLYQLLHNSDIYKEELNLARAAREVNEKMPRKIVNIISESLKQIGKSLSGSTVTVFGVTYKANVSDIRQSPVEVIVRDLIDSGALVKICDPIVKASHVFSLPVERDYNRAIDGSDSLVIATGHSRFKQINFQQLLKNSKHPLLVVDVANLLTDKMKNLDGIIYRSLRKNYPP